MKAIIADADDLTLGGWLADHIGGEAAISAIHLSVVPSEVVHVVTAVIARMTSEAVWRHVRLNDTTLPTALVMKEAHTLIKRYREDIENQDAATVCCQVFKRIACEERKVGRSLVLSSPTVV